MTGTPKRLAITGGTGFVGARLLRLASTRGFAVNALTRRPQPLQEGVRWIDGALDDRDAIGALVRDCDAVIHVAGVVNAPDAAGFEAGNVAGTLAILAATTAAGVHRFVHVSSLSAREPHLSLYGGSKKRAEDLVARSGLDWVIVRPPAVYGPGDRELLDMFKAARLGIVPLPPKGRLSIIHADDLSRLLLHCVSPDAPTRLILEPDDGHAGGYTHRELAALLAQAQGRRAVPLSVPSPLLRLGARIDRLARGSKAKLTADRAAYFCHPDWVADPSRKPSDQMWLPHIPTPSGLRDTADWYVENGWL